MKHAKKGSNKNLSYIMRFGMIVLTMILIVLFFSIMIMVGQIQGTARIVNYTGFVRGGTQRMVKLENAGQPQDKMRGIIASYINGLQNGSDELNFVRLDDNAFQNKMVELNEYFQKLTQENISYTSDKGKTYDFNTADKLNALLIKALVSTGELNEVETYDVDFDHQFLETEKYDAKPTYKKFLGYRPGVYVIGDMIVYVENSDGNTNVRFYQAETHKRFFALLEANSIRVNRFRADCGSCSKEIVSEIEKHCTHFYIRANRCSSLYDDLFSLRGWKTEEINGIQFELNSILVEKWEGKCYRLVIQRQKRMDGELDLWEGEYTYRCILTNDYDSSTRDIVEFYNKRGGKERIFDDMNNGFGWNRLPKSFMSENTVFLLLTALIHNFYKTIISKLDTKAFGLKETSRIRAFVFSFISVPAKWIMTARQYVLNIYTENRAYARPFKTGFG